MSHRLKLTLFVLAFNVIGFVEGYLLRAGASLAAADSVCDGGWRCASEPVVNNVSERISIEVAAMEQFSLSQWVSLALENLQV